MTRYNVVFAIIYFQQQNLKLLMKCIMLCVKIYIKILKIQYLCTACTNGLMDVFTHSAIWMKLTHWWFVLCMFLQLLLPPHSQQPLTHCHSLREDLRVAQRCDYTSLLCIEQGSHSQYPQETQSGNRSGTVWCLHQSLDMGPLGSREIISSQILLCHGLYMLNVSDNCRVP